MSQSAQQVPLLRPYMPELDTLRGVAILLVLFYHGIAPPLNGPLTPTAKMLLNLSQNGWVGVNLFFVLSGFLITGILMDSKSRNDYFRRFYIRRALRILPALYATLLVLLVGRWISWRFLAVAALFLANSAPLLGVTLQYPPLWSLAVEEHFYFLWPGLIRRFSTGPLAILLAFIAALTPAIRALDFLVAGKRADFVPLYTWSNLDGLAMGALLAVWVRQQSFRTSHLKRIALPLLVVGVSAFVLMPADRMITVAFSATACNLASVGLLSSMLLLGTSPWSALVNRPFLKFLGYISYGLYLVHVLAFRAADVFLTRFEWLSAGRPLAAMSLRLFAGGALAISVAYLSRRSLEEKFLRMGFGSRKMTVPGQPVAARG